MSKFDKIYGSLFLRGELTPQRLAADLGVSEDEAEAAKSHWDELLFASLDKERETKKRIGWAGASPDPERLALCRAVSEEIAAEGQAFYRGEDFNYYSGAYLPENLYVFATSLTALARAGRAVRYLEVGVNRGLSALAVWRLANKLGIDAKLTGVDPFFAEGYMEGVLRPIDKTTRNKTLQFLSDAGADFELIEATSRDAFRPLIRSDRRFDLIYIDGRHERLFPLVDIGSYVTLLEAPGVFMIDDYFWKDVFQLKHLFDKHAVKICESWKLAAYKMHAEHANF